MFFKYPFSSLLRPRNLVEYTVMNIEVIPENERRKFASQGAVSKKVLLKLHLQAIDQMTELDPFQHALADCWVVKSSQLGMSDDDGTHCRTHLGHLLQPGDTVLG